MVLEKPRDLCTTPRPLQSWRAQSWKPTWEVEHRRQNHHATNCSDSCCFLSLNFISFHAGVSWFWSVSSGQFVLTPVMCFVPWQSRVLLIIWILALLKGSNVFPFSTRDASLSISWWHLRSVISFFCSYSTVGVSDVAHEFVYPKEIRILLLWTRNLTAFRQPETSSHSTNSGISNKRILATKIPPVNVWHLHTSSGWMVPGSMTHHWFGPKMSHFSKLKPRKSW